MQLPLQEYIAQIRSRKRKEKEGGGRLQKELSEDNSTQNSQPYLNISYLYTYTG